MAVIKCYPGDPTDEETRMAIWKWAKEALIDKGMPIEKVGKEINDKYFKGVARPQLIADILGGRKTPLRPLAEELWRKQWNRRQITQQAQNLSKFYNTPAPLRALQMAWEFPRFVSTFLHSTTFPGTHAGMLLFRPEHWGTFARGWMDNWKSLSPAAAARIVAGMENDRLYARALKGKLDVAPNSRPDDIVSKYLLSSNNPAVRSFLEGVRKWGVEPAERGWDALKVLRFNLWKKEFEGRAKPDMTEKQLNDLSAQIADWANHATGSAKLRLPGMKESLPGSGILFGPKLMASKWSRLVADPAKTLATVAKMASGQETTAGERAAAMLRISGAAQFAASYLAFQGVNYGINKMLGVQDKDNVNPFDPSKSDWLNFKLGGLQIGPGGLTSEMRFLGKVIAAQFANDKASHKDWKTVNAVMRYAREHLSPQAQLPFEAIPGGPKLSGVAIFGTDAMGRPVPWSTEKGARSGFFQKMTPAQYAMAKLPIFMTGPMGYLYDELQGKGLSALQASSFIKGLALSAIGIAGFHAHAEPPPPPPKPGVKQITGAKR